MARLRLLTAGLAAAITAGQAGAINIVLDYTYDSQGFFNNATAKATLEKAAADLSMILTDSFSPIQVPGDYISDADGQAAPVLYTWDWSIKFDNPGVNGGPEVTIADPSFAADEYRIYAGGRSLGGTTLGVGGPGGGSFQAGGSYYLQSELDEINAISDAFDLQRDRGQTSGFSAWGGTITFDNDGSADWHYGLDEPANNDDDFYSVALHELMHAVGWGTSDEWNALAAGGFSGAAVVAEYGGVAPITGGHWVNGTMSTVLRDGDPQETAMDPSITNGDRKLLTDLDVAALDDIGWDIDQSFSYSNTNDPADLDGDGDVDDADFGIAFAAFTGPNNGPSSNPSADLDGDGDVDDADFGIAFAAFTGPGPANVPEPASAALLMFAGGLLAGRRRGR